MAMKKASGLPGPVIHRILASSAHSKNDDLCEVAQKLVESGVMQVPSTMTREEFEGRVRALTIIPTVLSRSCSEMRAAYPSGSSSSSSPSSSSSSSSSPIEPVAKVGSTRVRFVEGFVEVGR